MTIRELDAIAYKGDTMPSGLDVYHRTYYREVHQIYADVSCGVISREVGIKLKAEVVEAYNLLMECMEDAKDGK